jgi:hypothetical protein
MAITIHRPARASALAALGLTLWLLQSEASAAACLVKPRQVPDAPPVYALVVVPEGEAADHLRLGFIRATCPLDTTRLRAYVERLCVAAARARGNPAQRETPLGRSPELVCASGRAGLLEASEAVLGR